jgi:hypothetical protein
MDRLGDVVRRQRVRPLVELTPGSSLQEEWFQSDGSALANANRLVAKVGSTARAGGLAKALPYSTPLRAR